MDKSLQLHKVTFTLMLPHFFLFQNYIPPPSAKLLEKHIEFFGRPVKQKLL